MFGAFDPNSTDFDNFGHLWWGQWERSVALRAVISSIGGSERCHGMTWETIGGHRMPKPLVWSYVWVMLGQAWSENKPDILGYQTHSLHKLTKHTIWMFCYSAQAWHARLTPNPSNPKSCAHDEMTMFYYPTIWRTCLQLPRFSFKKCFGYFLSDCLRVIN